MNQMKYFFRQKYYDQNHNLNTKKNEVEVKLRYT